MVTVQSTHLPSQKDVEGGEEEGMIGERRGKEVGKRRRRKERRAVGKKRGRRRKGRGKEKEGRRGGKKMRVMAEESGLWVCILTIPGSDRVYREE